MGQPPERVAAGAHPLLSVGLSLVTRLITRMYFPGDPLIPSDPIMGAVTDPWAQAQLISAFDLDASVPGGALAFRSDLVLRGSAAMPVEIPAHEH